MTLSGRLRSISSSYLSLDSAAPGEYVSLSISDTGSPMLLLKGTLEIDNYCQDIPPSFPVLPPPTATLPRPQAWVPLDNYVFCGAFLFEQTSGKTFGTMAIDASLR